MNNTADIYSQLIIEKIIKDHLEKGEVPTIEEIEDEFNAIAATQDLNTSNFTSDEWKVTRKEESSATKYNNTTEEIRSDLIVLYRSLLGNSSRSVELFDRWSRKAESIENRLKDLESRISRLLEISSNTEGYFNSVGDKFISTELVDLDKSTGIFLNLKQNIVTIDKDNSSKSDKVDRLNLNSIKPSQVRFSPITKTNVVSITNVEGTEPYQAFLDSSLYWKNHIHTNAKLNSVLTELVLSLEEVKSITKIDIYLHSSQSNSSTTITPLVSSDGINFSRVPAINTVTTVVDKATFIFPSTEFQYLKLIFQKSSYDFQENNLFVYEFGAKEISLFEESFSSSVNTVATLISQPLSITKPDDNKELFNKLSLTVCEARTSETPINYYIAVGKDLNNIPNWLTTDGFSTDITVDDRVWYPITPVGRDESVHPKVLDLVSLSTETVEDISLSYNSTGTTGFVSPAESFNLLSVVDGNITSSAKTATAQRYYFNQPSLKILDLQLETEATIDLKSIRLWRNVGEQGLTPGDITKLVRGVQAGWEFTAPYYSTFIEIEGHAGISIDVGNNPIFIDGNSYTRLIGPDILSPGIHEVKVHQNYWNEVDPGAETISELKSIDILYPYNQKLLIEGYLYSTDFTEEKIYQGVDRFAGILTTQVSAFDILNNISQSDYTKFAIDNDIPETSNVSESSRVILVNSNNEIADFLNESFVLQFHLTDQLFSYLALKAELSTTNSELTPILDEYRIKLGL